MPQQEPVNDLLPGLVRACEGEIDSTGWSLAPQGEAAIDGTRTFAEVELYSGALVRLIPPPPTTQAEVTPAPPRAVPAPRIESMGEWDYLRTLDRAIAAGSRHGSTVIAVVGAQVGAGTTTISVLLSTFLASMRPERIVCVDANPQSGALSQWMVPDSAVPTSTYRSLLGPSTAPNTVEGALVSVGSRLWVLPAPLDPSAAPGGAASWKRLIEHLRRLRNVVVLDCGAGTQRESVNAAVVSADHIVFVTKPDTSPKVPASWRKPVVWVTNQTPRRARMRRSGTVPHVTVPIEQQAAALLKRRALDWPHAPGAWQEAVRELAAVLVAG